MFLPHPPTARLGGRPADPGPPGHSRPGCPGAVCLHAPCPPGLLWPPLKVSSQERPPRPPRVRQVAFASSLDTNRNILTDVRIDCIIGHGGRSYTVIEAEVGGNYRCTVADAWRRPHCGLRIPGIVPGSAFVKDQFNKVLPRPCRRGRPALGPPRHSLN